MNDLPQNVLNLLSSITELHGEWNDLGWDRDGCPDGDACEEFESKLNQLGAVAQGIINQNKPLSYEVESNRGANIAEFLHLKKVRGSEPALYRTTWGTKTARGLFTSMQRIMDGESPTP